MTEKMGYSDLEVVVRQSMITSEKYPVPPRVPGSNGVPYVPAPPSAMVRPADFTPSPVTPGTGAPAYFSPPQPLATEVHADSPSYSQHQQPQHPLQQQQQQQQQQPQPGTSSYDASSIHSVDPLKVPAAQTREPMILGLKKKVFTILVGAGLLLAILLAVILGVLLTRDNSSASMDDTRPGIGVFPAVHQEAMVSATNFTLGSGTVHYAVAYQAPDGAIMVAVYNETDNPDQLWISQNVTNSLRTSDVPRSGDVSMGTPVALVAGFPNGTPVVQLSLYFINSGGILTEVFTTDVFNLGWAFGLLTEDGHQVAPGSRLAASWQLCRECSSGTLVVAYQAADQNSIMSVNFTGTWSEPIMLADRPSASAGVALSAFAEFVEASSDINVEWHLYYVENENLIELANGPETSGLWVENGSEGNPIASTLPTRFSPQLASMTYGETGWTNSLVTSLAADGSMSSFRNEGGDAEWEENDINFKGGKFGSFKSIATNQALRMYGVMDGCIHEYITTGDDPFTWNYVNPIKVFGDEG